MAFNDVSVRQHLKDFAFTDLFVEDLGWDRKAFSFPIEVAGQWYTLHSPVHKAGLHVFLCPPGPGGTVPDYPIRRRIESQVAKSFVEHLIIFTDTGKTVQVWQWMKREKDQPDRSREHTWYPSRPGPLIVKLQKLQFTLEEQEQDPTIVDSTGRVRDAFDVEKVTKRFYEQFRDEHAAFLDGISGFPPPVSKKDGKKGETEPHPDLQWYTSLTLNRLMFVYFIQKKRFLDGDPDYLQNRLKLVRTQHGRDKFHSFYRLFLLHLFHEGLGKQEGERDPDLAGLIGKVPYLNGGFFEVHQLERDYTGIDIPDKAFKRLFAFFDNWDWVLDTRAPRESPGDGSAATKRKDEINPNVIGYIFEKYINQKQMGAYYTKEDITGYITQNTIIPFILDRAAKDCAVAFQPDGSVWKLLRDDPDRYIYEPVRRGVLTPFSGIPVEARIEGDLRSAIIPLPPEIEAGIADLPKRAGWNKPATDPYALPTETWREHVARRQRCLDLRAKLKAGEIHSVNDLITYNLDLRQFAQDIITNADGPELLKAIWQPLREVTVLDPTCGSGAFLFAALMLLEPLYAGCLDKMQAFLDEATRLKDRKRLARLGEFQKTLDGIARHANEDYFVLKTIIVNNLYGVDIMEEAVEICRLRLFLKLVAQLGPKDKIEPLPDIDFNVRAGNTLVGYATRAQSDDNLNFGDAIQRIDRKAAVFDALFQKFKATQLAEPLATSSSDVRKFKADLLKPLRELREELDTLLAVLYGQAGKAKLPAFRKSHQPFHWWVEFYGIMNAGGFNVVVGNPPYVEFSTIKKAYSLKGYETESCGNLYGFVLERSFTIARTGARVGMIVQLPIICTDRMMPLQRLYANQSQHVWFSTFDDRPSKLFDGLEHIRATIAINEIGAGSAAIKTTKYNRWLTEARPHLFRSIFYFEPTAWVFKGAIPKVGDQISLSIIEKLSKSEPLSVSQGGESVIYFHNAPQYWIRAMNFQPYFWNERDGEQISTQVKPLYFETDRAAQSVCSALNSTLFYWWFIALSDCRHLNMREIDRFPLGLQRMSRENTGKLERLCGQLMNDYQKHANRKDCVYKTTGRVIYDEYFPRFSKTIIDEIDAVIAQHFSLSDEELDYIQNFDLKYRVGETVS